MLPPGGLGGGPPGAAGGGVPAVRGVRRCGQESREEPLLLLRRGRRRCSREAAHSLAERRFSHPPTLSPLFTLFRLSLPSRRHLLPPLFPSFRIHCRRPRPPGTVQFSNFAVAFCLSFPVIRSSESSPPSFFGDGGASLPRFFITRTSSAHGPCQYFPGPGCSSIGGGAFTELGPFFPRGDGRGLRINKHSWNKGRETFNLHRKLRDISKQLSQKDRVCLTGESLEDLSDLS